MKIAYVSLHWPRTHESGVGKKIASQIQAWRECGHTAMLFMHTHEVSAASALLEGNKFFYTRSRKPGLGFIETEIRRITALKELLAELKRYQPDIIYLRYGMYTFPVHLLKQIAPTIIEINTNDLSQHNLLGITYSIYNSISRNILYSNVDGMAFVSHELSNDASFLAFGKKSVVIGNGINTRAAKPFPAPKNDVPCLVFIGSPHFAWHGIEKLIHFADRFPDIHIDIIGDSIEEKRVPGVNSIPNNIKSHGYLLEEQYNQILARADASIGTLSLYVKNMNEASPLKIRECAAAGLPLVLPYQDTDLDDLALDTILHIPNNKDNIITHGQAIHDFLYEVRGKRLDTKIVNPRIDIYEKEKKRLAFFQTFLVRNN